MKKAQMIFYAVSVIGFYISEALLYRSTASVTGAALLCMSILMLAAGVFCQWKASSSSRSWISSCISSEAQQVGVSC